MRTLLYVEASPRKEISASIQSARVFVSSVKEKWPGLEIDHLDLWNARLPEFDGDLISAKYANLAGREMSEKESAGWALIGRQVDRVKQADAIVISTPMWNFGIPYKLKHWIDLITQPGFTFAFDPVAGYIPLLRNRPAVVILSSAGDYRSGTSRGRPDLATTYLREALRFIGLADLSFVLVGPTAGPQDQVAHARGAADQSLCELAETFGRVD